MRLRSALWIGLCSKDSLVTMRSSMAIAGVKSKKNYALCAISGVTAYFYTTRSWPEAKISILMWIVGKLQTRDPSRFSRPPTSPSRVSIKFYLWFQYSTLFHAFQPTNKMVRNAALRRASLTNNGLSWSSASVNLRNGWARCERMSNPKI